MRRVINAAIIKDNKILVCRKKRTWILPGGKPEEYESDKNCLRREIRKEFKGTEIKDLVVYTQFKGTTPHSKTLLEASVYFANLDGELKGVSNEIDCFYWAKGNSKLNFSDITKKIINSLVMDNYLLA